MKKRNLIVGVAALLTAVGVWMALFGLPGNSLDYAAFAHNYDYDGNTVTDFHLEIDKVADGATFCEPTTAGAIVNVGDSEQVAVCATDMPPLFDGVSVFAFNLTYDDTLNTCVEPAVNNTGTALDDNPDANAGTTTWPNSVTGDTLGGGWDCSGFGLAYPLCDVNAATGPGNGDAKIGCLSLLGPYELGDDEDTGVLAVVTFDVAAAGIDNLALHDAVVGDETGAEIGTCNPGVGIPIPCEGAADLKQIPPEPPDIAVTKSCTPDPVLIGGAITCNVSVTNIGAGQADAVSFLDGEVAGTSLNFTGFSILPSDPGCLFLPGVGGGLSCPLGVMLPSAAFSITMNATAAGPEGTNTNAAQATVTAGMADAVPANNAATDSVFEYLPDINVNKLDVSGGVPGDPADGWTINLAAGACPGTPQDSGVTSGGTVSFDDLTPGTFCISEVLLDPALWTRADCQSGDAIANDPVEVVRDGSIADLEVDICNKLNIAPTTMTKVPDSANLWLCKDAHPPEEDCPGAGEGTLVINEFVDLGLPMDPQGVGAFEVQIKFDHKIFDIVASATTWLNHYEAQSDGIDNDGDTLIDEGDEYRTVNCSMSIINENSILLGCVSKDVSWGDGYIPTGQTADGVAATLSVTPESDLNFRLTPGQQNGVVRTILDENCELADIYGDPLQTPSTDQDGDTLIDEDPINGFDDDGDTTIDEDWVDEELMSGIITGGLLEVCGDSTITVRILEGDLNTDCEVDLVDDQMIAFRYGAFFGNLLYDPWFDLEPALKDFDVDIKDLQKVYGRNGSTCTNPIPDQDPLPPPP
jgi:hypothetical protein